MSKELSTEQNSLIEGLIEKHNPEGLYSLVDVQKGAVKAAMQELVNILSTERMTNKQSEQVFKYPHLNTPKNNSVFNFDLPKCNKCGHEMDEDEGRWGFCNDCISNEI